LNDITRAKDQNNFSIIFSLRRRNRQKIYKDDIAGTKIINMCSTTDTKMETNDEKGNSSPKTVILDDISSSTDVEKQYIAEEKQRNSFIENDVSENSHLHPPSSNWLPRWKLKFQENSKSISACTIYSFCSISMVLVNKSLASSYNHLIEGDGHRDLNILLVVFQAIIAVFCVEMCKQLGWVEYPNFRWETAKRWAPVNVFFCLMLFTSITALQYNSVPMVTIFKNIANISTCFGDYYFFGNKPEFLVLVAFGVMLSGAVAASWNDIHVSSLGLMWMCLNCLSTSGYVLYMKFATKAVKLSKFGMVFYNNVLCVLILLPIAFYRNEVLLFFQSVALHTPEYFTKNGFAGVVGFFLNFASLQCVAMTGPTTYAIIGSVNKVPGVFLGYWLFQDEITEKTWFFIAISMAGGFLYSYAKLRKSDTNTKKTVDYEGRK